MKILYLLFIPLFLFTASTVFAETLYVDTNIDSDCTNNYSINNRTCSGTDGDAYKTVASGVAALQAGDTLYIRQGTYATTAISIDLSGSPTTIAAYNDEAVTITKSSIRLPIFALSDSSANITFRGLTLNSQLYGVISGTWTNIGGNVWTIALTPQPTQIRFNTTVGTNVENQGDVNSANEWFWSGGTLYVYSTADPAIQYTTPGINQTDNYDAIGIGNTSGTAGNLITVDNCTFQNFAHSGIKGNYRYHILNSRFSLIGTDDNDHNIYLTGEQTSDNESIIEFNELNYTPGGLLHFYSHPAHIIVRYNILNGENGANHATWGVLLSGSYINIYNNSFYGNSIGVTFFTSNAHHNEISNNIFYGSTNSDLYIDSYGGSFYPVNNILRNNYFGSDTKCNGCTDQSGSGGDNYTLYLLGTNIQGLDNPYTSETFSDWTDFVMDLNSELADAGSDLGTSNQQGMDSRSTTWPVSNLNQNEHGSGWEIGAFVNYIAPEAETSAQSSTASTAQNSIPTANYSCSDPAIDGNVNLFEIQTGKNEATLFFTGTNNATKYIIFYGQPKKPDQFGTWLYTNSKAVISHKIGFLMPNTLYQFRVVPATDCLAGKSSNSKQAKTTTPTAVMQIPKQEANAIITSPKSTETITLPTNTPIQTPTIAIQSPPLSTNLNVGQKLLRWFKGLFTP